MHWLNNVIATLTGKKKNINDIKHKIQNADQSISLTDDEIEAYISDIDQRAKSMVKDLKQIYGKHGIAFAGFRSLDLACTSLRGSLKDGKEEAYNNLIKLESSITTEQKRHLALIRIAMSKDGKRVIDLINQDPRAKETFVRIFGERNVTDKENMDGLYQRLWSEIHKLSEYILLQKNKVYH